MIKSAAAAVLIGAAPGGKDAVVTLRDAVELAGPEVTLAAVGRIDTRDGDLAGRLAVLRLGAAPPPGRSLDLGRARVQEELRRAGLEGRVLLEGSDLVRVVRKTRVVTGAELAAAAKAAVERAYAGREGLRAECEVRSVPQEVEVPGGEVEIQAVPPAEGPGGLMLVTVRVVAGGLTVAQRGVPVKVRLYQDVVVAGRDLAPGAKLAAPDLALERREITGQKGVFRSPREAEGREVRVPIKTGEAVLASRVVSPLVVKRGDEVELDFARGGIRVSAKGRALQPGAEGDEIEVENLRSGRKLKGRVAGAGRVVVGSAAD